MASRFVSRTLLAPALLLVACRGCSSESSTHRLTILSDGAPASVEIVPTTGQSPLEVPVLLVNSHGAAVPGGDVSFSVEGASVTSSGSASVGADGYGVLEAKTSGPEMFLVTATSSADGIDPGEPATCFSVGAPMTDIGMMPAWTADQSDPPRFLAPTQGGLFYAGNSDVWYQPTLKDLARHRVLSMPSEILGLQTTNIDNDGILDVIVRTASELVVLRGRADGGASWGAGIDSGGLEIIGASAGDVDGDRMADIVMVVLDTDSALAITLQGDGSFSFEETEDLALESVPTDALLAHTSQDGLASLSVLDGTGEWIVYRRMLDGWVRSGTNLRETNLSTPVTFVGASDLNGGGFDDMVAQGAPVERENRGVTWFTTETEETTYKSTFGAFYAALGDVTGDDIDDIALSLDGELRYISIQGTDSGFIERNLAGFPEHGPITVHDFDNDGCGDVAWVGNALRVFRGRSDCKGPFGKDHIEGIWSVQDASFTSYFVGLGGAFDLVDLDGNGVTETLAGFEVTGLDVSFSSWRLNPGAPAAPPTVSQKDEQPLGTGLTPGALVHCGRTFFGIVSEGGVPDLFTVTLDASGNIVTARTVSANGTLLACGAFGDNGAVVVASEDGNAVVYDNALAQVGMTKLGALSGLAAADTDGDGSDDLFSCVSSGCQILAFDADGDGKDEVFTSSDGLVSMQGSDFTSPAQLGGGALTSADANADGIVDLYASDGQVVWIYPVVPGGLAPAMGMHTLTTIGSFVRAADIDGDGLVDLAAGGTSGSLQLVGSWALPE
jgi:hypothetical protein